MVQIYICLQATLNYKYKPKQNDAFQGTPTIKKNKISKPTEILIPLEISKIDTAVEHKNNKTALIVGSIAVALIILKIYQYIL